jgi:hypothetical protein
MIDITMHVINITVHVTDTTVSVTDITNTMILKSSWVTSDMMHYIQFFCQIIISERLLIINSEGNNGWLDWLNLNKSLNAYSFTALVFDGHQH